MTPAPTDQDDAPAVPTLALLASDGTSAPTARTALLLLDRAIAGLDAPLGPIRRRLPASWRERVVIPEPAAQRSSTAIAVRRGRPAVLQDGAPAMAGHVPDARVALLLPNRRGRDVVVAVCVLRPRADRDDDRRTFALGLARTARAALTAALDGPSLAPLLPALSLAARRCRCDHRLRLPTPWEEPACCGADSFHALEVSVASRGLSQPITVTLSPVPMDAAVAPLDAIRSLRRAAAAGIVLPEGTGA